MRQVVNLRVDGVHALSLSLSLLDLGPCRLDSQPTALQPRHGASLLFLCAAVVKYATLTGSAREGHAAAAAILFKFKFIYLCTG